MWIMFICMRQRINGAKNKITEWREFCEKFRKEGYKNVIYIDAFIAPGEKKSPIGPDYEACVDGIHFTDMGFARAAEFFMKWLK